MRKKLFIGTVDTLFENDNDSDSDLVERNEPEINFTQIDDQKLIDAYDSCLDQIQEPANININSEIKSTQNEDKMLIDAYDSCLHEIERADRKYDAKRELNDDCDDILNASYEKVKDSVEKSVNNRSMIPDNMIHLVRNSEKEIQRNHLLAKIRLIERSIKWSAKFKVEMSDYFIAIESWPNYAIEKLLSHDFGYADRIGLACFFFGNGLTDKDKALRIFQFYNRAWRPNRDWNTRFFKFQNLFNYLRQMNDPTDVGDRIRTEYWYYDMNLNLTMCYDGTIRTKHGEKRRYFPLFARNNRTNS